MLIDVEAGEGGMQLGLDGLRGRVGHRRPHCSLPSVLITVHLFPPSDSHSIPAQLSITGHMLPFEITNSYFDY